VIVWHLVLIQEFWLCSQNREEKLSQPLPADNVGRKMLEKLGYKSGESLGTRQGFSLIVIEAIIV
jgi:hypothetical protein